MRVVLSASRATFPPANVALEIVIFRNTGLSKFELSCQKLVWKCRVAAQRLRNWVSLSCSPGPWSLSTIPQLKHCPPEQERRNRVLLRGSSLLCRSCSTCHWLWWEIFSFCRACFGVSVPGTCQHPHVSGSSELSMKFVWLSAASLLKLSRKRAFSNVKN